jgi:hypothetical protein
MRVPGGADGFRSSSKTPPGDPSKVSGPRMRSVEMRSGGRSHGRARPRFRPACEAGRYGSNFACTTASFTRLPSGPHRITRQCNPLSSRCSDSACCSCCSFSCSRRSLQHGLRIRQASKRRPASSVPCPVSESPADAERIALLEELRLIVTREGAAPRLRTPFLLRPR